MAEPPPHPPTWRFFLWACCFSAAALILGRRGPAWCVCGGFRWRVDNEDEKKEKEEKEEKEEGGQCQWHACAGLLISDFSVCLSIQQFNARTPSAASCNRARSSRSSDGTCVGGLGTVVVDTGQTT